MEPVRKLSDSRARVPALGNVLASTDMMGVLTREVQVRLVNISASGCLVETNRRLEPGATGSLRVRVDGEVFADGVRVARVQEVPGGAADWRVGLEFVWSTHPGVGTLRRVAHRIGQAALTARMELEMSAWGAM